MLTTTKRCDSLRWLLEANGYRVRAYASGESFLEDYDPAQIGVLIADVRMPGMSGLELQEQLIARNAPLPIVFITGHGDVPMAVSTMKKGAVDFLENRSANRTCARSWRACWSRRRSASASTRPRKTHEALARLTAREQQVLGASSPAA